MAVPPSETCRVVGVWRPPSQPEQGGTAVKKKVPVVRLAERAEAARLANLQFEATLTLDDLAGAIKEGLLALSCTAGLLVIER